MKALILDFDGVICDSIDECLVTAYGAFVRNRGGAKPVRSLADVPGDLAARFRRWRFLVGPAGEFGLLLDLLQQGSNEFQREDFRCRARENEKHVKSFEQTFFAERYAHMSANIGSWAALHRVYPEFETGYRALSPDLPVYLVTTKDRISVDYFNFAWKLGIPADRLWTGEQFADKSEAVQSICASRACVPTDVAFVDDNLDHLHDVAATGCRCCWASWGYTPAFEYTGAYQRIDQLSELTRVDEAYRRIP